MMTDSKQQGVPKEWEQILESNGIAANLQKLGGLDIEVYPKQKEVANDDGGYAPCNDETFESFEKPRAAPPVPPKSAQQKRNPVMPHYDSAVLF